jgi:MFS family permease
MDLHEMKTIWQHEPGTTDFAPRPVRDWTEAAFRRQMRLFQTSEGIGFIVAYTIAGVILVHVSEFDTWYFWISGLILLGYLLIMPLYTMSVIRKMRKPDLIHATCKEVLEHFYRAQRKLKLAEKITFIANPFLFVSSMILLTRILAGLDVFTLPFKLPLVLFIIAVFIGATLFNLWAFKKRDKQLQSVADLLQAD